MLKRNSKICRHRRRTRCCYLRYLFGARIILDGGGTPSLAFVQSTDEQAEALARHREAQKASAPPPGVAGARAPAPPAPAAAGRDRRANRTGGARDGGGAARPGRQRDDT